MLSVAVKSNNLITNFENSLKNMDVTFKLTRVFKFIKWCFLNESSNFLHLLPNLSFLWHNLIHFSFLFISFLTIIFIMKQNMLTVSILRNNFKSTCESNNVKSLQIKLSGRLSSRKPYLIPILFVKKLILFFKNSKVSNYEVVKLHRKIY